MSACDTCSKPGACCKGFVLSGLLPKDTWKESAEAFLLLHDLPFVPVKAMWHPDDDELVSVVYDCNYTDESGRCVIYELRPELCKFFEAKSDGLCVEYQRTFKGILIKQENK